MTLSDEQKTERLLLVLYRLSQGVPGIEIKRKVLLEEINNLGIMYMSEERFQKFKLASVAKFKKVTPN